MTDITVHITVPRQLWDTTGFDLDLEEHDRILGTFIREAATEGERMISNRLTDRVRVAHIEITLAGSATAAEIDDNPDANTP